ncbi:atrial natriuretic peptide receptor 1-like [Amblyomma americanum]
MTLDPCTDFDRFMCSKNKFRDAEEIVRLKYLDTVVHPTLQRIYNDKASRAAHFLHKSCLRDLLDPSTTPETIWDRVVDTLRSFTASGQLDALELVGVLDIRLLAAQLEIFADRDQENEVLAFIIQATSASLFARSLVVASEWDLQLRLATCISWVQRIFHIWDAVAVARLSSPAKDAMLASLFRITVEAAKDEVETLFGNSRQRSELRAFLSTLKFFDIGTLASLYNAYLPEFADDDYVRNRFAVREFDSKTQALDSALGLQGRSVWCTDKLSTVAAVAGQHVLFSPMVYSVLHGECGSEAWFLNAPLVAVRLADELVWKMHTEALKGGLRGIVDPKPFACFSRQSYKLDSLNYPLLALRIVARAFPFPEWHGQSHPSRLEDIWCPAGNCQGRKPASLPTPVARSEHRLYVKFFRFVCRWQGIRVAIKPLDVKKIHVTRQLLAEIKMVHDLTHENLVRFVGLCIEDPNVSIITELCPRGSLRDMLENEDINIDWMFKCSMITDIVEGLHYLHGTPIQYHGRLKSTKCIVDGRFVVKLSDYGLRHLHAQLPEPEDKNPSTPPVAVGYTGSMFWTAPEFLRLKEPRQHSSQKGDIYAFAIILQEVITRSGPYESLERIGRTRSVMEPEEILDRVKMGTTPPFRPEVSPDECPADVLRLMRACWAEVPTDRPTIAEVRHAVKKITKFSSLSYSKTTLQYLLSCRGLSSKNFFDNLLQRMEQYANNLESLVEEKTESLMEEKKRTDELLYQLLPRYVADELKKGSHVQPEAFESVTIFFSDIVGFTSLSADSSPMQVVTLLNDLYTCFDGIIDKHDAYKVETIGDAYLVASGLPIRNGNEHVREIARIALMLREQLKTFKIRHLPKRKLQLRIGIHSGPCVAGVVGLKMPKYCLFGDTVNTASRMETTGEPLKIHVSSKSKELLDLFGNFVLTLRGEVQVKGKGVMTTYWLEAENNNKQPEADQ